MDISKLTYEEAIKELEKILDLLENNDCSLEESIDYFKRGIELHKYCNNILNKTEENIKILLVDDEKVVGERDYFQEVD